MCMIFKINNKSSGSESFYNSVAWNEMLEGWRRAHYTTSRHGENDRWELMRQGGTGSRWAGWCKANTGLYSMETSSRRGQEGSRKQRGLWINKFCALAVNASPKALETKHLGIGVFLHNCFFPTLSLPCNPFLRMCKTCVTYTAILHCSFLLHECLIDHTERTMPDVLQRRGKTDHKLPKSLSE